MKKIFLFGFLFIGFTAFAQQIKWLSLEEALEAQKDNPKKIFMDVYTKWCGPCKLLDRKTFANPYVAAYISENYYAVKFDAEGQEEIKFLLSLFDLAPKRVCNAFFVTKKAVSSYLTISPLPL